MIVTVNAIVILGLFVPIWLSGYLTGKAFKKEKIQAEELPASAKHRHQVKKDASLQLTVASPVSGRVSIMGEEEANKVTIFPEEGNLYSPVSGKIIKLYPMGNAFAIRTDIQTEVEVQVGREPDELCAMYFCPRVIQNEIVNKGKLLLAFDKEHLQEVGEEIGVTVGVHVEADGKEVIVTQKSSVKVGDSLMEIYDTM